MSLKVALIAVSLSVVGAQLAAAQTEPPCKVTPQFDAQAREIVIDWNAAAECLAKKGVFQGRISTARIDEGMSIAVRSTHFNFVNYTLRYEVEETVVESYVLLAKLWEQILGLGDLSVLAADIRTRATPPPFQTALLRWINAIVAAERAVEGPRNQFTGNVHLSDGQLEIVAKQLEAATTARDGLLKAYNELPQFDDFQDYERYGKVRPVHEAVLGRVGAYLDLASLTLRGQLKNIGKKKGGTFVTVTITPAVREGSDGSPVLITEYFSHSRFPLTFHAGYVGSALDDFDFEQVRALGGRDLFAAVKTNTNIQSVAAFLSYELRSWRQGSVGVLATIGTDFSKPGERLYLGGSVRMFRRVMLSVGGASAEVKEGVSPVFEQVGDALNARELFGAISTRRAWEGFVGLSFGVF
jgi:hypothetical protein